MSRRFAARHNTGFTLVEILVVMAISMILMVLVMAPVLRSFELTRRAQAMVDAQDSARIAIEQISREIGESMDVLDYTADPIELPVYDPNGSGLPDDIYWLPLPYSKIDLIMPKMIVHCNSPDHDDDVPRDFERGDEAMPMCPSGDNSTDVDIRPKLPLEQGNTVVRYFLGLKHNSPNVSDGPPHPGWQSPYGKNVPAEEGNPVVLYRIEFDPNDKSIFDKDAGIAAGQLMDVLRDPRFFYRLSSPSASGANWSAQDGQPLWKHWAQKARALGLAKYQDLVAGLNPGGNGLFTAMEPSVTFRYAKVDKETFAGVDYGNTLSEFPNAVPTVFRSKFGYWTPNSPTGITQPYGIYVYRYAHNNDGSIDTGNTALYYTSIGGGNDLVINRSVGGAGPVQVFNISEYMENGYVDYDNMPANTDMGFCFDYGNGLLNFNRGVVNFALNVKPLELDAKGIQNINQTFLAQLDVNRNPLPRMYRLPAVAWLSQATIVPGSEVVTGPDMTPGADPSVPVRYERVPLALGDAEINQYRIDYRTGDVFFSRIPSQDLPDTDGRDTLTIAYKIQFNKDDDVVQGDYQTKAMINVHLGIRMYDPDSGQPHMVELNNAVKLRNAYR